jgi:hypothetical protein
MDNIPTPLTDRAQLSLVNWRKMPRGCLTNLVAADFARELERELYLERARTARAISILKQCVLKKDETDNIGAMAQTVLCNLQELANVSHDILNETQPVKHLPYGKSIDPETRQRLIDALRHVPDDL